MGTNCCTVVKEGGEPLVFMWRHLDGDVDGHGKELRDFLKDFTIVNGMPLGWKKGKIANGMECLAAQMVSYFKGEEPGGFYLTSPCGPKDVCYFYEVYQKGKSHRVKSRKIGFCTEWSIFIKTYVDGKLVSDKGVKDERKKAKAKTKAKAKKI